MASILPTAANFERRRARYLAQMQPNSCALFFNSTECRDLSQRSQAAYFFYLTGCTVPDAALLLVKGPSGCEESLLFAPTRTASEARWRGPVPSRATLEAETGCLTVPRDAFSELGREKLARSDTLYHVSRFEDPTQRAELDSILTAFAETNRRCPEGPTQYIDWQPMLDRMRLIKDSQEIHALREAAQLSMCALEAVIRSVHPGQYEYQAEALLRYHWLNGGAKHTGYEPIVASGARATVLHYEANNARMSTLR